MTCIRFLTDFSFRLICCANPLRGTDSFNVSTYKITKIGFFNDDKNYRLMSSDNNYSAAYLIISTDITINHHPRISLKQSLTFNSVFLGISSLNVNIQNSLPIKM